MSDHTHSDLSGTDPVAHAGCEAFERTLSLLDGVLEGEARSEAEGHAAACAVCAPLVAGWEPVSRALFDAFEDAAEAAKPDLAGMPDRVLARVFPSAPVEEAPTGGGLVEFFRRAQAWLLLGATAAALAFVLPALLETPEAPRTVATNAPPEPAPPLPAAVEDAPPYVVVRDLDFGEETDGMIYRTPRGGMTIIWVTENEGA